MLQAFRNDHKNRMLTIDFRASFLELIWILQIEYARFRKGEIHN